MDIQTTGETLRNTLGTLQVVFFLVFCVLGREKAQKCTLGALMPILVHVHAPCYIIGIKMPPSGRAHPHLHSIQD